MSNPPSTPTCLITGANRGIGRATALGIAARGYRVGLLCRDETGAAHVAAEIAHTGGTADVLPVDLASQPSVRAAAADALDRFPSIDVLVHNAAVISRERRTTTDDIELQLAVNHLAPFLLTALLRHRLVTSHPARVVIVASNAHYRGSLDLDDLQSARRYRPSRVYAMTKLANVLFMRELSRRLQDTGVTANALHPGTPATGLLADLLRLPRFLRPMFERLGGDPSDSAHTSIRLATAPELSGTTGRYFNRGREQPPSRLALDDGLARELWERSAQLTGVDW